MIIRIAITVIVILYCVITLPRAIHNLKEERNVSNMLEPASRILVIICGLILLIAELLG